MYKVNEILDRDNYKIGHWLQLKKAFEWFQSYMTARLGANHPFIYFVGLSFIIKKHYSVVPTMEEIDRAERKTISVNDENYFNRDVWERINKLGYYPMLIKGLPEGTKVPINVPQFIIEPTEDWFASTCNGEETKLMRTWYPTALVTRLMILRSKLKPMFEEAGCLDALDFSVNGFEMRSATSKETSDIAGMISLFVNRGGDNLGGSDMLDYYYPGCFDRMKSIWATEHACALSFGPDEGEYDYVKAQLSTFTHKAKSILVDTFNTKNFVDNVITRPDIVALIKSHKGLIVLRNDSGDIPTMINYILNSVSTNFGTFIDKSGYRRLNEGIAIIQADGVNPDSVVDLYKMIFKDRWSPSIIVVGGGTGLMFDELTRDYNRNAIKPSVNKIDGEMINVNKVVASDPTKGSMPGKLKVTKDMVTHSSVNYTEEEFESIECIMVPYYHNGKILDNTFHKVFDLLHSDQ